MQTLYRRPLVRSAAIIGLALLLTACPGSSNPPPGGPSTLDAAAPGSLGFTAQLGSQQELNLSVFATAGEGEVEYEVSVATLPAWLAVTAGADGAIASGGNAQVSLEATCGERTTAAPLTGNVVINNPGDAANTLTVPVTLSCVPTELPAAQTELVIDHDVEVLGMVSDRFTWLDANGWPRSAVLAHNDNGPHAALGNTHGGALRQFTYHLDADTERVVNATTTGNGAYAGFGYVVSHRNGGNVGIGTSDSPLGHRFPGTWERVLEGRHHAIFRFQLDYPRWAQPPSNAQHFAHVTIDWMFGTGMNDPVWAITWDLTDIPANAIEDDSRAPYGELLFDGSATSGAHSVIDKVFWGTINHFETTTSPVTYNSDWEYDIGTGVRYNGLEANANAMMGIVMTRSNAAADGGGYWGYVSHGFTSANGPACGPNAFPANLPGTADHQMLCNFNWPYQSINYSMDSFGAPDTPTNNTRLAWGTNFGFLGQEAYDTYGYLNQASGWPYQSYSTFIVLGPSGPNLGPVRDAIDRSQRKRLVEFPDAGVLAGEVVIEGPAGPGDGTIVGYDEPGYNHIYSALEFRASDDNELDIELVAGGNTVEQPLLIIGNYDGDWPVVTWDGVELEADVDFFASLWPERQELWITLDVPIVNGNLHRLQVNVP